MTENQAARKEMKEGDEPTTPSSSKLQSGGFLRSGNIHSDLLQLYMTGSFYDCTFSLKDSIDTGNGRKIFKCHKIILANASEPFEKLLDGSFKEGQKERDDAIEFGYIVSAEVFDLAMRFVYGGCDDFKTFPLAIEVYKFANQWQILHLIDSAEKYIATVEADNVMLVFDMYKSLENEISAERYLKMIQSETKAALNSNAWLSTSPETVLRVCQEDNLTISEVDLLKALVKWGEHGGLNDVQDVRKKIASPLKKIRFRVMTSDEFSELCKTVDYLTEREKLEILMCITLLDASILPPNFTQNRFPRHLPNERNFYWGNQSFVNCTLDNHSDPSKFDFCVSEKKYLLKLQLISLTDINTNAYIDIKCSIYCSFNPSKILGHGTFTGKSSGSKFLTLDYPVLLLDSTIYTAEITYHQTAYIQSRIYTYGQNFYWTGCNFRINFRKVENTQCDVIGIYVADVA